MRSRRLVGYLVVGWATVGVGLPGVATASPVAPIVTLRPGGSGGESAPSVLGAPDAVPKGTPRLRLLALDRAAREVVVALDEHPPVIFATGEELSGLAGVTVHEVLEDRLVVRLPADADGARSLAWVFPVRAGERWSRVQPFEDHAPADSLGVTLAPGVDPSAFGGATEGERRQILPPQEPRR